jgi:hypothetical protein
MNIFDKYVHLLSLFYPLSIAAFTKTPSIDLAKPTYKIYPDVNETRSDLLSPFYAPIMRNVVLLCQKRISMQLYRSQLILIEKFAASSTKT